MCFFRIAIDNVSFLPPAKTKSVIVFLIFSWPVVTSTDFDPFASVALFIDIKKRMGFHPCHQFILRGKHVFGSQQKHISCTDQSLLALKSCHGIFMTLLSHNTVIYIISLVTWSFLCFTGRSARTFSLVTENPMFWPTKCFSV